MTQKNSTKLFDALGNGIRFNIINYLCSGEKCVCCILKKLNLPQNLVSHHLAILRKNGLITDHKNGKWVYYSLNKKNLEKLKKTLNNLIY